MTYRELISQEKLLEVRFDAITEQMAGLTLEIEQLGFNSKEAQELFKVIGRLVYLASGKSTE